MNIIIANILLVFIMLVFTVFILKNVIKRINQSAKKWFVDKLQEYNYLVDEKEKKLNDLREQIEQSERELNIAKQMQKESKDNFLGSENVEETKKDSKVQAEVARRPEVVYDIPIPKYKEENFFQNYKQLKKKFDVDSEEIIRKFLQEHKKNAKEEKEYKVLDGFCNKFSPKILYECSTLEKQEQYELVLSVLTEEEKKFIEIDEEEVKDGQFTIRNLVSSLKERIKTIDPTIYVYVGKEDIEYEEIDDRIKTSFYKNMSEGVIIHYKGKMYDYSI